MSNKKNFYRTKLIGYIQEHLDSLKEHLTPMIPDTDTLKKGSRDNSEIEISIIKNILDEIKETLQ